MAQKSPRRKGALQQAKEYLRINPTASNAQVVEALNISIGTVTAARSFLVQTGVIRPSFYDRTSEAATVELPDERPLGPIIATSTARDLARAQEVIHQAVEGPAGEPLTAEEQRQRLSAVARSAAATGNFQLEIAAIQALARLDAQLGARDRLGPGPPLTDEDKIHRLYLLLEAVGKRIARKAWERAFSEQFTPQDQPNDCHEYRELGGSPEETPLPAPANDPPDYETRLEPPQG